MITAIIPTYRRPRLLKRAILSVLSQTYPNLRVLVLDNASGDETESVVKGIAAKDSRVFYYRHPENIGSYNNFNYGLKSVKTPFFSLLSDDDMITPRFYEKAMKGFEKFPETMAACAATMAMDENNLVLAAPVIPEKMKIYEAGAALEGALTGQIETTWTGAVFRREVVQAIGVINVNAGPPADGGFVYHCLARFPMVVIPEMAAILMSHKESTSGRTEPLNKNYQKYAEIMLEDIIRDSAVKEEIKLKAKDLIRISDPKKIAFLQVTKGLSENNFEYAQAAARGVADFGYNLHSRILRVIVFGYKNIFFARWILNAVKNIRKFFLKKRYKKLTRAYSQWVDFVNQLNVRSQNY